MNKTTTTTTPKTTNSDWWIFGHVIPILIILLGNLGNTFAVLVLRMRNILNTSTGFYMKALAMSDNYVMMLLLFRWLSNIPSTPVPLNTWFCIFYFFFARLGLSVSAWILMCMTLDR